MEGFSVVVFVLAGERADSGLPIGILPEAKTCRPIFCAERKNRCW